MIPLLEEQSRQVSPTNEVEVGEATPQTHGGWWETSGADWCSPFCLPVKDKKGSAFEANQVRSEDFWMKLPITSETFKEADIT